MKKTLLLVLFTFGLGVLTPRIHATLFQNTGQTTLHTAKQQKQPKSRKSGAKPQRSDALALFASGPVLAR